MSRSGEATVQSGSGRSVHEGRVNGRGRGSAIGKDESAITEIREVNVQSGGNIRGSVGRVDGSGSGSEVNKDVNANSEGSGVKIELGDVPESGKGGDSPSISTSNVGGGHTHWRGGGDDGAVADGRLHGRPAFTATTPSVDGLGAGGSVETPTGLGGGRVQVHVQVSGGEIHGPLVVINDNDGVHVRLTDDDDDNDESGETQSIIGIINKNGVGKEGGDRRENVDTRFTDSVDMAGERGQRFQGARDQSYKASESEDQVGIHSILTDGVSSGNFTVIIRGQTGIGQAGSGQIGSGQIGSGQLGSGQIGSGQLGSGLTGRSQIESGQTGSGQLGSGRRQIQGQDDDLGRTGAADQNQGRIQQSSGERNQGGTQTQGLVGADGRFEGQRQGGVEVDVEYVESSRDDNEGGIASLRWVEGWGKTLDEIILMLPTSKIDRRYQT